MNDSMQTLLGLNARLNAFPPNSRYHGIETDSLRAADGREIVYMKRRFVPAPERFALIQEHTVVQGERPDTLAARFIGDPEQFWRLCDANRVIFPDELTAVVGRRVRITLPQGIPAVSFV